MSLETTQGHDHEPHIHDEVLEQHLHEHHRCGMECGHHQADQHIDHLDQPPSRGTEGHTHIGEGCCGSVEHHKAHHFIDTSEAIKDTPSHEHHDHHTEHIHDAKCGHVHHAEAHSHIDKNVHTTSSSLVAVHEHQDTKEVDCATGKCGHVHHTEAAIHVDRIGADEQLVTLAAEVEVETADQQQRELIKPFSNDEQTAVITTLAEQTQAVTKQRQKRSQDTTLLKAAPDNQVSIVTETIAASDPTHNDEMFVPKNHDTIPVVTPVVEAPSTETLSERVIPTDAEMIEPVYTSGDYAANSEQRYEIETILTPPMHMQETTYDESAEQTQTEPTPNPEVLIGDEIYEAPPEQLSPVLMSERILTLLDQEVEALSVSSEIVSANVTEETTPSRRLGALDSAKRFIDALTLVEHKPDSTAVIIEELIEIMPHFPATIQQEVLLLLDRVAPTWKIEHERLLEAMAAGLYHNQLMSKTGIFATFDDFSANIGQVVLSFLHIGRQAQA